MQEEHASCDLAIVGCGPMGLYTLKWLIASAPPLRIVMLDASDTPGAGMPYSDATTSDEMLCNAFSMEIPSLTRPFIDWLQSTDPQALARWKVSDGDIRSRAFFPRTLLGAYLQSELHALIEKAAHQGHSVFVRGGHRVTDILPLSPRARIIGENGRGAFTLDADEVVIATGHVWPETPGIGGVALRSPWPSDRLETLSPTRIGIVGSSLSAIDVALTLGAIHGSFEENGDQSRWFPKDGSEDLRITLLSTKGVMPEADFHYDFPYQQMEFLNERTVEQDRQLGAPGLLDRVFARLLSEVDAADPGYLDDKGPEARTVEGFAAAYFERRMTVGGLRAVRETFREARAAMQRRETIAHRYVFLRADAMFDLILRDLDESDMERFRKHLLPVFADAYAAVPHRSVARIIALHDAGVLDVVPVGEDAGYERKDDGEIAVTFDGETLTFREMVDARGQRTAALSELPFPSLVAQVADAALVEPFRLDLPSGARVHCLSLPQILERYPFSQGLSPCCDLSRLAVDDILASWPPLATGHPPLPNEPKVAA